MLLAFERQFRFWFVFNSNLSERLQKYDGYDVNMNIKQNTDNLFKKKCKLSYIISLYIIFLNLYKFHDQMHIWTI